MLLELLLCRRWIWGWWRWVAGVWLFEECGIERKLVLGRKNFAIGRWRKRGSWDFLKADRDRCWMLRALGESGEGFGNFFGWFFFFSYAATSLLLLLICSFLFLFFAPLFSSLFCLFLLSFLWFFYFFPLFFVSLFLFFFTNIFFDMFFLFALFLNFLWIFLDLKENKRKCGRIDGNGFRLWYLTKSLVLIPTWCRTKGDLGFVVKNLGRN